MEVDERNDENSKKTVENMAPSLPAEPLLGSITTNTLVKEEKGIQIRTSARVFKKMKLEQEQDKKQEEVDTSSIAPNTDHPASTAVASTEHEGRCQPIRCSTRVVKKPRHEVTTLTEAKGKKEELKTDIKEVRKWTFEEKIMFFEAINEFGREFENIQNYINSKLKKKGASDDQIKSKSHVRYFYMKTFHEVSKHVKFAEGVRKVVQELYGIINYGELYKKLGVLTEKTWLKLNELIYRGKTLIRVKGKTIRIMTPMCRALIKLNQLNEKYEEVKLPNRVTVEIRPKDMTSYVKVQCMAQNPRLRTTLPIQKRLISLIQCLDKRWRTTDTLIYEKAAVSTNPITSDCVPSKENSDEMMKLLMPALRLTPPPEAKIELPSINISEYLTRQTICLSAYESRLGLDTFTEIKKSMSKSKKSKLEVEPPKVENVKNEACDVKVEEIKVEENEVNHCYEIDPDAVLADAVHDAVNTILSLQALDRQQSETSEEEVPPKSEITKQDVQTETNSQEVKQEDLDHIDKLRKGWTQATSESLTIGELYLMYGSDTKLILEYSWGTDINENEKPKKTLANFLEMWNETFEESWESKRQNITSSLSKLLSLAKIHYKQDPAKCSCGHVCNDKNTKNSANGGSRVKKATIVDNNISIKQEDNAGMSVLPEVPNGRPPVTGGFRVPTHILPNGPTFQTPTMQQQLNSIRKLKPKFCNRTGRRPRQKPIVVERKLPLLPNNLSGHQIVRMRIISQEPPVIPAESNIQLAGTIVASGSTDLDQKLDLQDVITDPDDDNSIISTVPSSPLRILKEGENEWINADVADYSLSSLLGHLESPIKTPVPLGTLNSNMAHELSNEVDAQLQSLMTETSMDFAASFADLAASVVSDRKF